jgi:hypothetical protein
MFFSPRFAKILSLALATAFSVPAQAQNMDQILNEVLGDLQIAPSSSFQGRDVNYLRDQILQAQGDFIDAALRRGHNGILGERIGQVNDPANGNRRRFFSMQDSFSRGQQGGGGLARGADPRSGQARVVRDRDDRARLVTTEDGEQLIACRQGTVETRIIDPTERGGAGASQRAVFVQLCAGEQFTEEEVCRLNLNDLSNRVRTYSTQIERRIDGVTNWVAFTYSMEDPPGFEGCSTIEGLNELLRRSAISGEGRENFGGAMTAVRMNAIYRACTDFKRRTIRSEGSNIGELESDGEFVRLARQRLRNARFIFAQTDSAGNEVRTEPQNDLFGTRFQNGMEGSRQALARIQRQIGRANNGIGRCGAIGGPQRFGGGFVQQGQGMRGNQFGGGMRGGDGLPGIRIGR